VTDELMASYLALGGGWPSSFTLEGKPHVKKRPRFGNGHAYKEDGAEERATKARLVALGLECIEKPQLVVLVAHFWLPDARTKDFDNLKKHLADAANGVLWADDSQVKRAAQLVDIDRERPRTEVLVGLYEP
jgi:Holliday junction resolvase RusA-like endonuclease